MSKKKKTAHLFLHFPCFDGVISAVLAWHALARVKNLDFESIQPINYGEQPNWIESRLPDQSVVVDFLFHPEAIFWVDHHQTTFLTKAAEQQYLRRDKNEFIYDRISPSSANILWYHFPAVFRSEERLREMTYWANKIDSADYASVEEAMFGDAPAIVLSQGLAMAPTASYCEYLVRSLLVSDLAQVSQEPQVRQRYLETRRLSARGLRQVESTIHQKGNIAVFEADGTDGFINRYSPYYFFPTANYSIGLVWSGDQAKITVMRNPWKEFQSIDLGQLLRRYGGGGHQRVASMLVSRGEKMPANSIVAELCAELTSQDRNTVRSGSGR